MTGISLDCIDRVPENDVFRTVEQLRGNSGRIVEFLARILKQKYGIEMGAAFVVRTSLFFEAPQRDVARVGYSRDRRLDRPWATIGTNMGRRAGMPVV